MLQLIKNPALEEILVLRFQLLRQDLQSPQACEYPGDRLDSNFHFALRDSETQKLTCIATFHQEAFGQYPDLNAYRLRAMATVPEYFRQGLATKVLSAGIEEAKSKAAKLIWFNARIKAIPFYHSMGFEIASDEFDILGIGPHKLMFKML
jgi:predicted GNAT family N-acyltransferase